MNEPAKLAQKVIDLESQAIEIAIAAFILTVISAIFIFTR